MSIVLVGGHDRMQDEYKIIADKYGHRIKVFTQMSPRFDKIIGLPDAIDLNILCKEEYQNLLVKNAR